MKRILQKLGIVSTKGCVEIVDEWEQHRKWKDLYTEIGLAEMYPESRLPREKYIEELRHSVSKNPNAYECFDWVGPQNGSCYHQCEYFHACTKRQLFEEVDCVVILEES